MSIYVKALGKWPRVKYKLLLNVQIGVNNDLAALQNCTPISARKYNLKINRQNLHYKVLESAGMVF